MLDQQVMLSTEKEHPTFGGRHPRLYEDKTTPRLKELIALVQSDD